MNVGWIGLGDIGTRMAVRVAHAGHTVTAYARGNGQGALMQAGGTLVADYVQAAEGCDLLCVCVYSEAQCREILLDHGVLAVMRAGAVLAIHTTASPALMQALAEAAPEGVEVLDATFSGGPEKASEGTLTLIVGGEYHALNDCRAVFALYASTIHHVGQLGNAQVLKLLNNLLFAANLKLVDQALSVAVQQGLAPGFAATIIQDCSGMSLAMGLFKNTDNPAAVFSLIRPYLEKDVAVAKDAANSAGIDLGILQRVALSE